MNTGEVFFFQTEARLFSILFVPVDIETERLEMVS